MENKSKLGAKSGQLTRKEKRLLAIARRLEKELNRMKHGLPEEYYRHGFVSVAEAAKQLDCRPAVLVKEKRLRVWRTAPAPKGTRVIPVSEIRRGMEGKVRASLEDLVLGMWEVLKPKSLPREITPWFSSHSFFPMLERRLGVGEIAERLHITPGRARRLLNADGPESLAAYFVGHRLNVSSYELEAFEKAHGQLTPAPRRAA